MLKVRSSPLDTAKKWKKLFFIMPILGFVTGIFSFFYSPRFSSFAAILIILPIILKIKADYEFYEKGIRVRARFMPWEDFKDYKKERDEIILIADIKHF